LFISLDAAKTQGITSLAKAKESGAAVIAYGSFINTVIDFTIVAFCIFMVIKVMNSLKKKPVATAPSTPAEPSKEERLLMEIRDVLKARA
jgi:large conductance mechanosensitive channel